MTNFSANLTKESKTFLENLRLYLMTSGKRSSEIEEIVGELEDHLLEAETNGKPINKIIGQTPKQYMEQLSNEMANDYAGWLKYVPIIIVGMFAYIVIGDVIEGKLSYSVLQLIGYPVIGLFFIFLVGMVFRHIAANQPSKLKESTIFYMIGLLPICLFIGLIMLDRYYDTPVIYFGSFGIAIMASLSVLTLIGVSVWSKTWISIVLPIIMYLPGVLLDLISLQEMTKIWIDFVVVIVGAGGYFWVSFKLANKD